MAAKKVLFLVGDFAEDYEVMEPYQALTMLGYAVHAVCSGQSLYRVVGQKGGQKSSWNQTDDSFTEPHGEIASSLRSSQ